ncbi:MAG TPA: sigma-54 dependent transcriptional regulator, partial [Thermoanaerobaculia bacterium]|nr:sigma-54 dependent transcriptional regulator [Thermoanaerobaculia bacterium]
MPRILLVEDDPKVRADVQFLLDGEGYETLAVDDAEAGEATLARLDPPADLLLVDVRLPGISGVDLVRRLAGRGELPATVVLSGEASVAEAVEALRLGARDFVEKPFSRDRLLQSIRTALETTRLRGEVARLRREVEAKNEILGESPAIAELRQRIASVAATDARVLIRGESGTGKELVADAVHRLSDRAGGPFVRLNCAAIAPQLVEAELFGHARGAFTDAKRDKPGLFEVADGGVLLLDEIGDMDLPVQARLLRVLEDGKVRRVGETRERAVDVRVLAATNVDLESAVAAGLFREDLFYRLARLPLDVPPLRSRGDDVHLLADHFLALYARRHRVPERTLTPAARAALLRYPWPGNVRELQSLCERLTVFGADPIDVDGLPEAVRSGRAATAGAEGAPLLATDGPLLPLKEWKRRAEAEYLARVL